jgi:hypothetical protein
MCFLKRLGFHDHAATGIIQARATCSEQSPRSTGVEAEVIGSNRQGYYHTPLGCRQDMRYQTISL